THAVPINDFYHLPGDTPERETVLSRGELITAILLPPANSGQRSHYLKVRDRAEFEFALLSAAVAVTLDAGGRVGNARVAMGGVGPKPWRLTGVEAALTGAPATAATIAAAAAHAIEG